MPSSRAVQHCVAARVPRGAEADVQNGSGQAGGFIDRSSAAPYRSAARRLRGRFAGDPVRLQRSLMELARRQDERRPDAGRRPAPALSPLPTMADGDAAGQFAALVRQHLRGSVLYYADRQSLLASAGRLGIGRFDANLIIAAVQHRLEREHAATSPVHIDCFNRTSKWWPAAVVVLLVEITLSLAVWWMIRR